MQTELICARPTKKYPEGRTGTRAGYLAHYQAGEPGCKECLAGHSQLTRSEYQPTGNLPGRPRVTEEHKRERLRLAAQRWRALNPERARELSRRYEVKRDPERRNANRRNTQRRRREAVDALKSGPCADCGVCYPPYVMQFDHRDPKQKLFNIGSESSRGKPWTAVLAEVAKCDVVCANCHAERSWGPKAP